MVNESLIEDYREAFNGAPIGFEEPNGELTVSDCEHDKMYVAPAGETDESFLDRINRSKESGRNLFFEEWPIYVYPTLIDPDIVL